MIDMLTSKQIAQSLGITEQTVNRLARENKLGKLLNRQQRVYSESDQKRIANIAKPRTGRAKKRKRNGT
jgi:predicted transcriptional regulator